jgi:hypothetical protein
MSEVKNKDSFNFVLFLNNEIILNRTFDGGVFEQTTKETINIRDRAKDYIYSFKKSLSSRDNDLSFELSGYDLLGSYLKLLAINSVDINDSKLKISTSGLIEDGYYVNKDENFKFVLYYKDKSVIERNFYVKDYNPKSRFSVELLETFNDVVYDIESSIKDADMKNIYKMEKKNYSFSLN